jgi:hypothetical protein
MAEVGAPVTVEAAVSDVEIYRPVIEPTQIGFLVTGDRCDRCGDVNYDEDTLVCLTCTYPDDPCSRAFLEAR